MDNLIKKGGGSNVKKGVYYSIPSGSSTVTVDMGETMTVNVVGYGTSLYSDNYYNIDISTDNENWTRIRHQAAATHHYHYDNQTARYIRFSKPNNTGSVYGAVVQV